MNIKNIKKLISLMLIALIIAGILISCGEKSSGNTDGDNNKVTDAADNQSGEKSGDGDDDNADNKAEERIEPNLPDSDFGGYKYLITIRKSAIWKKR